VQAGLLLATSAAFLTPDSPRVDMINYTPRDPYICILASFALLLGGIIVASAPMLVLYANRFHVYCIIIMLSYPFFSIGITTLLFAFGLLSAVWCSEDQALQGACVIMLFLPISIAILFGA
ncbi:hypothetical protein J3R30DRAFT_3218898, partial [Lentinula aciculospora]